MAPNFWIIDDDAEIRSALSTMCTIIGYETRTFNSAKLAGQTLLSGILPKLIFLDINMPGVGGFEFLKFVREKERWNKIIIIMVSSESEETQVEKAIRLGADGYVFKPINFDELKMAIRTAAKRRASTSGLKNPLLDI
jgi:two-component system chemotaxis response regulator CheY